MENKEKANVRNRIHRFADKKKRGSLPLQFDVDYNRTGIKKLLSNGEDLPNFVSKSSSALLIDREEKLNTEVLSEFQESYDLIFWNASRSYSYDLNSNSNSNFAILDRLFGNQNDINCDAENVLCFMEDDSSDKVEFALEHGNESNLYLTNGRFEEFTKEFVDVNHTSFDKLRILPSVLFLLKSFDVVHTFDLGFSSDQEDDFAFTLHFLGYISQKDLYV